MKNTEELNALSKPHTTLKTNLQCSLIIALCFLWTATGYLSWMYHLWILPKHLLWIGSQRSSDTCFKHLESLYSALS